MNRRGFLRDCGIGVVAVAMPVLSNAAHETRTINRLFTKLPYKDCLSLGPTRPVTKMCHYFGEPQEKSLAYMVTMNEDEYWKMKNSGELRGEW